MERLHSDSSGGMYSDKTDDASKGNVYFYPVDARSPPVEMFQQLIEIDLLELKSRAPTNSIPVRDNLNKSKSLFMPER